MISWLRNSATRLFLPIWLVPAGAGLLVPGTAMAAWPIDGLAVSTVVGGQYYPAIVSDGAGGAIIAWLDRRTLTNVDAVFAQHVLATGVVDPAWPAGGLALAAHAEQQIPALVSDGAGGAIVTWYSSDANELRVFAQHVLAGGVLDSAWPADGRALASVGAQTSPTIASDGAGGAVVAWTDDRTGNRDIFAQHVLANGQLDAAWPPDGQALCTAANRQEAPTIVSDGAGGAIVAWNDLRTYPAVGSTSWDIYAQHVRSDGTVDPAWPTDGRALCTAEDYQTSPRIVSDGAGGALVTWQDLRGGYGHLNIFAQHVGASGVVDPAWPVDGRALSTPSNDKGNQQLVADGTGGAIIAWDENPTDTYYVAHDVFAQHVLASGSLDPGWPAAGLAVCTAPSIQSSPEIVADGAGGAVVTWEDYRSSVGNDTTDIVDTADIYAQHVLASGTMDPTFPADGLALSTAARSQILPQIVSDGGAGAIVTWGDCRADASSDIFALHVDVAASSTLNAPRVTPPALALERPRPDPASTPITLRFSHPHATRAHLAIYDVRGRRIRQLISGEQPAGEHAIGWDLRDDGGQRVGPGLYFLRLETGDRSITRKLATLM